MPKPFKVRECEYGVEIFAYTGLVVDGCIQVHRELLTVEEAEDLAHQLFDAARERRMNAEDYLPECVYAQEETDFHNYMKMTPEQEKLGCRRRGDHFQNCFSCEDYACGDNINPNKHKDDPKKATCPECGNGKAGVDSLCDEHWSEYLGTHCGGRGND